MDDKIIPFEAKNEKPSVKSLTLTPLKPTKPELEHREMETLAEQVAMEFRSYDRSLRKLHPQIELIHNYFATSVRGSVTLAGCVSFSEYCTKKLGRTRQAVYSMLGEYPTKAKERKQQVPKGERDDEIPREAVIRMRTALDKVQQARYAKTEAEKAAAWKEYDEIAAAQPLPSAMEIFKLKIAGDRPDYQRLLRDVLLAALQLHSVLTNIVEAAILDEGSALLAAARAALDAGKILAAVRKRLSFDPTMVDRIPADSIGSQSLLQRYGPRRIQDFFGLETPRRVLTSLAMEPRTTRLIFVGALGTGKSSLAIAFANEALAEVHYVPAKSCDLQRVQRLIDECRYVPSRNFKRARAHVCIVDEADQMSAGAQAAFLSVLDDMTPFTNPVIFIFTTNNATTLEEKFRSRCDTLEFTSEGISVELETKLAQVWKTEGGDPASAPDFANMVCDCGSNVRAAFNVLEMELLFAKGKSASDCQESLMRESPGDETART